MLIIVMTLCIWTCIAVFVCMVCVCIYVSGHLSGVWYAYYRVHMVQVSISRTGGPGGLC